MSKQRLFGTDGVRGVANEGLTAPLAMQLGMAAGHWVRQSRGEDDRLGTRDTVIVGRDTRLSGDMLEAALAAGISTGLGAIVPVIPPSRKLCRRCGPLRAS